MLAATLSGSPELGHARRYALAGLAVRRRAAQKHLSVRRALQDASASRRPPQKCGAFRLQPRGSRRRQTACWNEPDFELLVSGWEETAMPSWGIFELTRQRA